MIIKINTLDSSPIYEQLRDQIIMGIAGKQLAIGEALPSVRRLGADLGINFHTVNKAYTALCDEGYIEMDRRKGALVAQAKEGPAFDAQLSRKLALAAAEAICHGMSKTDFVTLCESLYQQAGGKYPSDSEADEYKNGGI